MRTAEVCRAWVVYRMTLYGGAVAGNVVCEQREWDALDRARPGFHTLLHAGIKTEQEAERLARGTAGADKATIDAANKPQCGIIPKRDGAK